ncbi:MAG: response regulator [Haloarculaceae archaeon]
MSLTLDERAPTPPTLTAPIAVLVVDDDPGIRDFVKAVLTEADGFEVTLATGPNQAIERLDGTDCVVSDYEMPGRDGLDLLADVRDRKPGVPFVLYSSTTEPEVVSALHEREWTSFIAKNGAADTRLILPQRVRQLVACRRFETLSRQALTALDVAADGLAIVDRDGEFTVVNRAYAQWFGHDRDALVGESWHAVYTDEGIDRLESTAIPAVEDGWRWTGECPARRADGEPVVAPTSLVGLDDGGLVVAIGDNSGD